MSASQWRWCNVVRVVQSLDFAMTLLAESRTSADPWWRLLSFACLDVGILKRNAGLEEVTLLEEPPSSTTSKPKLLF